MTGLFAAIGITIGAVILFLIVGRLGLLDFIRLRNFFPPPDPIAADDFSYPDGPVSGRTDPGPPQKFIANKGGRGAWNGAWGDTRFDVKGGEIGCRPPGLDGQQDGYAYRNFDNPKNKRQFFVSFDLRVDPGAVQLADAALVKLSLGSNGILDVGKQSGSNEIQLGHGGFASSGISLQSKNRFRIVACYDQNQRVISLWVDPAPFAFYNVTTGGSNANVRVTNVSGLFDAATVTIGASRQGYFFDNLVLADTPDADGIDIRRQR